MSQANPSGQSAGQTVSVGGAASVGLDGSASAAGLVGGSGDSSGGRTGRGIAADGSASTGAGPAAAGNTAQLGTAAAPGSSVAAAAAAAAVTGATLVFDGAGNLVSGGTTFGDVPPTYSGKQVRRPQKLDQDVQERRMHRQAMTWFLANGFACQGHSIIRRAWHHIG